MLKHLVQVQGLGSSGKNETVIFGGTSAGGVGAIPHLDHVAAFLKPHNVKVLGYIDSGLYFNIEPYKSSVVSLYERMRRNYNQFQENDEHNQFISSECAKNFDKESQWQCIYPEHALKYVKTPFVLISDSYDDYHLGINLGNAQTRQSFTQGEMDYAYKFGNLTKNYLQDFNFDKSGQ